MSAQFPEAKVPSVEMLKQWIDESYRAQAPKKLVKQLDAGDGAAPVTTNHKSASPDTRADPSGALSTKAKKPAVKRVS